THLSLHPFQRKPFPIIRCGIVRMLRNRVVERDKSLRVAFEMIQRKPPTITCIARCWVKCKNSFERRKSFCISPRLKMRKCSGKYLLLRLLSWECLASCHGRCYAPFGGYHFCL